MYALFRRVGFAVIITAGISGCNLSDSEMQQLAGAALAVGSTMDVGQDRQRSLANSATEAYLRSNRRSRDTALENKLQRMTMQLSRANGLGSDWTVFLIDDPQPNALTPGGGIIFVHTGFLKLATSEAQMAMVLAHEMAHTTEGHAVKRQRDATLTSVAAKVLEGQTSTGTERLALDLGTSAALSGYSRSAERDADRIGFEYYVRAGYNPYEAATVFRNIQSTFGERDAVSQFIGGTHPRSGDRARKMDSLALGVSGGGTLVTTNEYERLTRRYR